MNKGIALAAALAVTSTANASTGIDLVLAPMGDHTVQVSTDFIGLKDSQTTAGVDVDLLQNYTAARFKLNPGDDREIYFGVESEYIRVDTNSALLPRELNDQSVALGFEIGESIYEATDGWHFSGIVGIGFAGDKAYNDSDAIYFRGDLIAETQLDVEGQTSLLVVLNYDGNRSFLPDVPLPAIAYQYKSEELQFALGVPYSFVNYHATEQLRLKASGSLGGIDAKVEFDLIENLTLYASYENKVSYFTLRAPSGHDRVSFEQSRAEIGFTTMVNSDITLTVGGGLAFDQKFEQGFDARDMDLITELDDEAYLRIGINIGF